ncbi:adenosine deaminase [Lancefieldella parvula]|uniref:adenosine deaminase n=1 Tax=Lancefieldella parvula TaxID=1382 RepID=UPI0028D7B4F4|nr:adenosine deaminase [Lancefieldella parvula]
MSSCALIDLHVHLDGSIPLSTAAQLAAETGLDFSLAELQEKMQVPAHCQNLNQYLATFELPLKLMQSEQGIRAVAKAFHKQLDAEGILYAEPRFAPGSLTAGGLSQQEVLEAALAGRADFFAENPQSELHTAYILCAMRGTGEDLKHKNEESIDLAAAYLGKGVVAADLAGAEALFATENFSSLFAEAQRKDVPFTIHAGEATGPESIKAALRLGAQRIGHGVRSLEDVSVIQDLKAANVTLEICPTSNLQTRIFESIERFPLEQLLDAGLTVTINTDNMTASNTTLSHEFELLQQYCGLDKNTACELAENAARAVFSNSSEKDRLLAYLRQ